jgi:hypothetical protein
MTLRQSAIGLSLVFIVTVLPVQSAFAQVCRGAADLTPEAHLAGGAAIGMSDEAVDLRGVVAGGHAYLAEFHAGVTLVDVADATVFGARLIAGGQIPVTLARRVMTCPLGTVAFGYSPDFDGLTLSLVQLGGGAAIGGILSDTDTMQTILAGSILAERVRARFANDAGGSLTQRVTVTTFEVAMGLVFSRRYTLRPAIAFEHVEGDWTRRFLLVFVARAR